MYFLYVLKSQKDNKLYIGTTDNLERRIHQHNSGQSKSEAMKREWYFKNTTVGNKLMKILIR